MYPEQNKPAETQEGGRSLAETGNASNPSPHHTATEPMSDNQLLSEGAETYLREGGNIEDMPDAQDQQEMDEAVSADE